MPIVPTLDVADPDGVDTQITSDAADAPQGAPASLVQSALTAQPAGREYR